MILLNSCTLETLALLWERRGEDCFFVFDGSNSMARQARAWKALCREAGSRLRYGVGVFEAGRSVLTANPGMQVGYTDDAVSRFLHGKRDKLSSRKTLGKRDESVVEVPEHSYLWRLPQRHSITLSLALAAAESHGLSLTLGWFPRHPSPEDYKMPDLKAILLLLLSGIPDDCHKPSINLPYERKGYVDILKSALELGAPLERAWVCSNGMERQCGVCSPCLHKRGVFRRFQGILGPDKTNYMYGGYHAEDACGDSPEETVSVGDGKRGAARLQSRRKKNFKRS